MVTQFKCGKYYILRVSPYIHIFKVSRIKYDKKDNCNILYIKDIYNTFSSTINYLRVSEPLKQFTRELTEADKVEFL